MSTSRQKKQELKLKLAGDDCAANLGSEISARAAAMQSPQYERLLADESAILQLRDAADEEAFLSYQLQVSGARTQIDLEKCRLPETGGGIAAKLLAVIRKFLWRILKFAFGWLVFNQNVVNEQLAIALDHEVRLRRKENSELLSRIEQLEARLKAGDGSNSSSGSGEEGGR